MAWLRKYQDRFALSPTFYPAQSLGHLPSKPQLLGNKMNWRIFTIVLSGSIIEELGSTVEKDTTLCVKRAVISVRKSLLRPDKRLLDLALPNKRTETSPIVFKMTESIQYFKQSNVCLRKKGAKFKCQNFS